MKLAGIKIVLQFLKKLRIDMASKVACLSNINKQNPFRYDVSLTEFKEHINSLPFCYRDQLITDK